jgi:hypothetical protein
MKPFDLEAAKAGTPLITRDGRKTRLIAHIPELQVGYRVIAVIEGNDATSEHFEDGRIYQDADNDGDLFMHADTRTVYVNIFPGGHADWFDTESEARAGLNARALKIAAPVTFEV